MSHLKEKNQFLSRRQALKALAAAGGATALSTLPPTWEKPLVKVGALPAFAQTSPGKYPFTNQIEDIEFEDMATGRDVSDQFQYAPQQGWIVIAEKGQTVGASSSAYYWIISRPWIKIKRKWKVIGPPWAPMIKIKIKIKFFARRGHTSSNIPADDLDFWCFGISGAEYELGNFLYYVTKLKIKKGKIEIEFLLPAFGSGLFPFYLSCYFPFPIILVNGNSLFPGYYLGPGIFGDDVSSHFLDSD